MQSKGIIFILSAPSGTGKTTICKMLKEKFPNLKFSVSHTTRKPRNEEKDGVDYHFIPLKDFEKKIDRGEFLEWAKVFEHFYGTAFESVDRLQQKGEDILIEIDVQGAKALRDSNYEAIFIFMLPPSLNELETRLNKRDTESKNKIRKRMEVGKNEIKQLSLYDYILTNFNLEETTENLLSIIRAERCRKELYRPPSPDLSKLLDNRVIT